MHFRDNLSAGQVSSLVVLRIFLTFAQGHPQLYKHIK
jgi:hypothetical protein